MLMLGSVYLGDIKVRPPMGGVSYRFAVAERVPPGGRSQPVYQEAEMKDILERVIEPRAGGASRPRV